MRFRLGFILGYFFSVFFVYNYGWGSTIKFGWVLLAIFLISYFFDHAFKQEKIKDE